MTTKLFGEGKILGREPTLWVAVAAALLNWVVGFQLDFLSSDQAAWMNTVINAAAGIFVAFQTRPIAPQVFTYAFSSVAGLLASYGLDMSQEMVASTQGLILMLFALVTRSQVSPIEDAKDTGVLGDKVTTDDIPTTGEIKAEVTKGIEDVATVTSGQKMSSAATLPPAQSTPPSPPPAAGGRFKG